MILVPINRTFRTASIGYKNKILFCKKNSLFHSFNSAFNSCGPFLPLFDLENHIGHFCMELEIHTSLLQVSLHRQNQRFILVVTCKFQSTEVRQPCNMVDKSLKIQLHFQGAVPVLKGKHSPPVQPES